MQERSYLGKIVVVSLLCRMVLAQMITWVYKDSLTVRYPPNINILTGITILIPMGSLVDTIVGVDS